MHVTTKSTVIGICMGLSSLTVNATDLSLFTTVYDTDWTSSGVSGTSARNNAGDGTADISLSGTSGTITEAYLYWHGPTVDQNFAAANSDITFAGTSISGDFLGVSDDNCWAFTESVAYRADVTSLITGDGTYSVSDYSIDTTTDTNGFSLIVFYDDGDSTNNRDVVMFDGNDSNINNIYDADGWNILLENIDYTSGDANMQLHVADGQSFSDDALTVNATVIEPAGPIFSGDSLPVDGAAGNGALWDINDYNVTSLLSPGLNDLNFTTGVAGDCLACVLIAIDLPAGAAPPPPNEVPVPATAFLFLSGLIGLGYKRKQTTA